MRIKFAVEINLTGSIVRTPKKPATTAAPSPSAPAAPAAQPDFDPYQNSADNG